MVSMRYIKVLGPYSKPKQVLKCSSRCRKCAFPTVGTMPWATQKKWSKRGSSNHRRTGISRKRGRHHWGIRKSSLPRKRQRRGERTGEVVLDKASSGSNTAELWSPIFQHNPTQQGLVAHPTSQRMGNMNRRKHKKTEKYVAVQHLHLPLNPRREGTSTQASNLSGNQNSICW